MKAWRVRGRTAALCCAVLAATFTGCGEEPPRSAADSPQGVLDRRAEAVLDRDASAFLATVDPTADRYRAEQRTEFANLAEVPLSSWSYTLLSTGDFPLVTAADGSPRTAAHVELRYRVEGYDSADVTSSAYLTMTERDGRWYVASDSDGERSGRHTAVHLWDQGRVRAVRGTYSLVLGVGDPAVLREYAAEVDRAVPAVRRAWGGKWNERVVVHVPETLERMADLLDTGPAAYRGIAAVTTGAVGGSRSAPADRVVINPEAFESLGGFGRQVVLTHETTHVATRAATTSTTPLWLSEGFADWAGYLGTDHTPRRIAPGLARVVPRGHLPESLPSAADFTITSDDLAQSYESAWLACLMIAERWGPTVLADLYREAGQRPVDAAMRQTLGIGVDVFTQHWQDFMERRLRP